MSDKKFILMNIHDKNSKELAKAISNKTSRKIIDFLADNPDSSEKDIADNLNLNLNTTEYNLKNLLKTGLIIESKTFFWSKKGKKIKTFKLANRHIVISPKKEEINMKSLKEAIIPMILAAILIILLILSPISKKTSEDSLNSFSTIEEYKEFIKLNTLNNQNSPVLAKGESREFLAQTSASQDVSYSTTNIQVLGVDEADIIKNDAKYIYKIVDNKIVIVKAYPANELEIESEIIFQNYPAELFINKNKLIILGAEYTNNYQEKRIATASETSFWNPGIQKTFVYIYDLSDIKNPILEQNFSISGYYFSSRMINDYVYIISNQDLYNYETLPVISQNQINQEIAPKDIYYSDIKGDSFQNVIISAISLNDNTINSKAILSSSASNIYVSQENIYITSTKYPYWYTETEQVNEFTIINKIELEKGEIIPSASGQVKGHILNQFSMDEYNKNLRIATTIGDFWNSENPSSNNLYILDNNLKLIGSIENLAPGEDIYSARFLGEKGYIVTFKKVDPLFVLDLSNPTNPQVLGKLKIPG